MQRVWVVLLYFGLLYRVVLLWRVELRFHLHHLHRRLQLQSRRVMERVGRLLRLRRH